MRRRRIGLWLALIVLVSGCGGGGGGGGSEPSPQAPAIGYGPSGSVMTQFTFAVGSPVSLTPNNNGGVASSWAITSALPAGLSFNSSTGAITGTPSSSFAPTNVSVTATNSGGSSTVTLTLRADSVLLNLGATCLTDLSGAFQQGVLAISSSNVLTLDCGEGQQHWVLWNYATRALVAQGDSCPIDTCAGLNPGGLQPNAELAGPIAVVPYVPPGKSGPQGFQVISTTDGGALGSVAPAGSIAWYHLASDGSYICGALASGGNLTVWAPDGSVIATVAGNYAAAKAYCAPGEVRVALGPKGSNVIETITVPGGVSSVSPGFAGTFQSWFLDGSAFLTDVGTQVWIYSPAVVQIDHDPSLSTVGGLAGWGAWFWTADGATLNIYKVGASNTPTASYPAAQISPSGSTIGILGASFGIIDLSGATPTETDYTPAFDDVYAAVSASQWVVGSGGGGAVVDGPSLTTTPRYFGYGRVLALAGSSTRVAVATSIGNILIFNSNDLSVESTMDLTGTQLGISANGTVLAVLAQAFPNFAVDTISLPSGAIINTWAYPYTNLPVSPVPASITLSSSGALLGQVLSANGTYTCQVTSSSGGPVLWSVGGCAAPIVLSLDDTLIAVLDGAGSNIYLNDSLSSGIPAIAVGWLQGDELLANLSAGGATAIFSSGGIKRSGPSPPDILGPIQALSATSIYDERRNAIYSLSTGEQTWTPPADANRTGTVAGPLVVFTTLGNQLVAEPY